MTKTERGPRESHGKLLRDSPETLIRANEVGPLAMPWAN
jgi:hypothetical protein